MKKTFMDDYMSITKGFSLPPHTYTTPDEEGARIKKCSILEPTTVGYSNETKLNETKTTNLKK